MIYIGEQWLSRGDDYVQYIINHEIGHAIGITTHSSVDHDMYAAHVHSRYSPQPPMASLPGTVRRRATRRSWITAASISLVLARICAALAVTCGARSSIRRSACRAQNLERDGMDFTVCAICADDQRRIRGRGWSGLAGMIGFCWG